MALTTVTIRPTTTVQLGSGVVTGAGGDADAALADSSDSTYLTLPSRIRLPSEKVRVGFATPTVPATAKVYSVTLRRRIQTVATGGDVPICHHWFSSPLDNLLKVAGQSNRQIESFFNSNAPTAPAGGTWIEETVGTYPAGPNGLAWDTATNLSSVIYEMGRGDDSTSATVRVSAVYLDVSYQSQSTVTVTGPTGTITDTRPTVTWTYASSDSQPQQAFRVALYTAAQAAATGFVPFTTTPIAITTGTDGWVLGEDQQWTAPDGVDLTDGDYVAYVQVQARWAGLGDFTSDVENTTWTRAATPLDPPPPAELLSAVYDYDTGRVVLEFRPGGSDPDTTAYTVQASRNGGISWQSIPRLTYIPADGDLSVTDYDYVAPLNVISQYRVIAYNGSLLSASTEPSNVVECTPIDNRFWWKHPSNPLLNTVILVAVSKDGPGITVTRPRTQGYFEPVAEAGTEALPIIVDGATHGGRWAVELLYGAGNSGLTGREELAYLWPAMDQLDNTGGVPLLWQWPDGSQYWVRSGGASTGQDTTEIVEPANGNPRRIARKRRKLTLTQTRTPSFF